MTRRARTGFCPGCGTAQRLIQGDLAAHYTDGDPMPVHGNDYARMCAWSLGRPDATRPASAAFVETARRQADDRDHRVDTRGAVACAAGCGREVSGQDWQVTDGSDRWHSACWHATQAPGQGDLLELLEVENP